MYFIGLDVGTTGTKAVVTDEGGITLGSAYKDYPLHSDGVRVTQNADDWWSAAVYAVRGATKDIDKSRIAAISLSTQAASMLCTDKDGNAISEVITWMDSRASAEARELSDAIGAERIYKISGWLPNPVLDAAKILWLRNNEPHLFAAAHKFVTTLEFMNMKLCRRCVIDPTNAAMRQLYNITSGKWSEPVLSYIGITEDRLPEVLPIGADLGTLCPEAAAELSLPCGVHVYNGAHDQYCAAVGCGAVEAGDMLLATGTTWVILGITSSPLYTDNHISPGIHPTKGLYGALASIVSAGSALNWYRNICGGNFASLDAEASLCRDSAASLFVLPYVCGAGFPHMRPDLRGAMFGLDAGHKRGDIARALMEGVAFEAAGVLDGFAARGMKIDRLMMTGGAARSELWTGIVQSVTGCEIYRMREKETCCMGAAMTAAVSCGAFADYSDCKRVMVKADAAPGASKADIEFYLEKRARYEKLAAGLKDFYTV